MSITLPPDVEQRIADAVEAGQAKSADDLVARILRAHFMSRDELIKMLDEAEADYDANGGEPWEEVRARLDARLARDD